MASGSDEHHQELTNGVMDNIAPIDAKMREQHRDKDLELRARRREEVYLHQQRQIETARARSARRPVLCIEKESASSTYSRGTLSYVERMWNQCGGVVLEDIYYVSSESSRMDNVSTQ